MTRSPRGSSGPHGFTLMEIVVVTFLLGLLLVLVVVRIDHVVPSARLHAASRELGALAPLARNEAVTRRETVRILYDLDRQAAWMELGESETGASEKPRMFERSMPHGVSILDISFEPDRVQSRGRIEVPASRYGTLPPHTVHLQNDRGDRASVVIHPITATPSFYPYYKETPVWESR